jgi:hypothetical protein
LNLPKPLGAWHENAYNAETVIRLAATLYALPRETLVDPQGSGKIGWPFLIAPALPKSFIQNPKFNLKKGR